MASGWYDFVAGAKPLATEWDDYVSKQVVMVFADASARNTALASVLREGMFAYLSDADTLTCYTGSTWVTAATVGQWTAYTPSTTNITLGTGSTNTGRWSRYGRTVHVVGNFTLGTGGSFTGEAQLGLPFTAAAHRFFGTAYFTDASTAANCQVAVAHVPSSADYAQFRYSGSNGAAQATVPFTWTTGDSIWWSVTFEASS